MLDWEADIDSLLILIHWSSVLTVLGCDLQVGKVIASWIKLKLLTLDQVIKRTQEACSSSGQDDEVELRESGGALTLICCTLEEMAKLSDPEEVSKAWKAGGYSFEAFVPQVNTVLASRGVDPLQGLFC